MNIIKIALKKALESFKSGQYAYAEEIYRQILRISEEREAYHIGSLVLTKTGKTDEGLSWALKALRMEEDYEIHNNVGLIYGLLNSEKAIYHFEKAISLNPKETFLHVNLALEYKKRKDYKKAFYILESIEKNEHVYFNYGSILHEMKRLEKAIECYEKSIAFREMSITHYNLSACYFLLSDYDKGWKEYEWRWLQFDKFAKIRQRFKEPYWNGEDLTNKTIVLYCEQGIGDIVMFYRFIKHLKGRVVLECPSSLHSLFDMEVCEKYEGKLDYHCSIMSLPGILKCSIESDPYLTSNDIEIESNVSEKKIGLCWTGNPNHPNDKKRSCLLSNFVPLGKFGKLFSFQKDIRPHAYNDGSVVNYLDTTDIRLVDLSHYMTDFNKTAKMLEQMDLVVTVDTSVAHLSGALGKKTFLLLPWLPDWRWGIDGEKTPWYSSVTLFRQEREGDWKPTFEKMLKRIEDEQ